MNRFIIKQSINKLKYRQSSLRYQSTNYRNNTSLPVLEAGFGKYLVILSPFIAVGGVAVYAKNDESFRKWLVTNIPAAEQPLKYLIDDQKPANDFSSVVKKQNKPDYTEVTKTMAKTDITPPLPATSAPVVKKSPPASQSSMSIPVPPPPAPSHSASSKSEVTKTQTPEIKAKSNEVVKETIKPTPPSPSTSSTPSIKEPEFSTKVIEKTIENLIHKVGDAYNKANSVLKSYKQDVEKIVDESTEKFDYSLWSALKGKTSMKDNAIQMAEKCADEAKEKLNKIENELGNMKNLTQEELENIQKIINDVKDNLQDHKVELGKRLHIAEQGEKLWKKVESAREYYLNQVEDIFPGMNIKRKTLNLSKDDLDLFLLHAYSHVLTYQKEMKKLENETETKLKRLLSTHGMEVETITNDLIESKVEKAKRQLALENQREIFKIRAEAERRIVNQIKQLTLAHADHLKEAIELKENEMKRSFAKELDEKLANEEANYKLEIAKMLGKLKGMDEALKARAHADRSVQKAQELWSACIALWRSVKFGDPTKSWDENIKPLEKEINAISAATVEGDHLIPAVLRAIPDEVRKRGVYTENALRERFHNVEKIARKLAMVPENGAKLPIFFLSYLQSMFILNQSSSISKEEKNDEVVDFSKLDTYDILNRAKYWLDHGNFELSYKYMNLLNGAPKKIAKDWINEVRIYLETQQAVNALLAYAESTGYSPM